MIYRNAEIVRRPGRRPYFVVVADFTDDDGETWYKDQKIELFRRKRDAQALVNEINEAAYSF